MSQNKIKKGLQRKPFFQCDTDRIQTCDLLIRSQMLYSAKLRCHPFCDCKGSEKYFLNK